MATEFSFVHRISADDAIDFINDAWVDFANENGASDLPERVLGSQLWNHISGLNVDTLYRALIERVRVRGQTIKFPFRCDAPDTRRWLEMEIRPLADSRVEFRSRVTSEESRQPIAPFTEPGETTEERLKMCAWCKRVQAPNWVEIEVAIDELGLFAAAVMPEISHTVCQDCRIMLIDQLSVD